MGENFDICAPLRTLTPEERTTVVRAMEATTAPLFGPIRWISRILAHNVTGEIWDGRTLQVSPGEIICLYPIERSASAGGLLVECVPDHEIWTVAVPAHVAAKQRDAVLEVMWRLSDFNLPCIGGHEYSLAAVLRSGMPLLEEAASPRSLATHAVVHAGEQPRGWFVLQERHDKVLITRSGA